MHIETGEYAGFGSRFAASALDAAILVVIIVPLLFALRIALRDFALSFIDDPLADRLPLLIILSVGWMYYASQESSRAQGTFGKRAFKLRVASLNRRSKIGLLRATARYFGRWLSILTFWIGYVAQPATSRRQALHDVLTRTVVVTRGTPSFLRVAGSFAAVVLVVGALVTMEMECGCDPNFTTHVQISDSISKLEDVRMADVEFYARQGTFPRDMKALALQNWKPSNSFQT